MRTPEKFAQTMYQVPWPVSAIGTLTVLVVLQYLTGTCSLFALERPRLLILLAVSAFGCCQSVAQYATRRLLLRWNLCLPTVMMWFQPMAGLCSGFFLAVISLVALPHFAGRGFWTDTVRLNAKTTTVLFSHLFFSFSIFIILLLFLGLVRYIMWSLEIGEGLHQLAMPSALAKLAENEGLRLPETESQIAADQLAQLKNRIALLDSARNKGQRFNRATSLAVLVLLFIIIVWIVFARPALILFYRAEIQLRSMTRPRVALATLEHLENKYADYPYLDTVRFRMAWIHDRRLHDWPMAIAAYTRFLQIYGYDNVWADDCIANLVRIHLEKQKDYTSALFWTNAYREHFPAGLFHLHMSLYQLKILRDTGRAEQSVALLDELRQRYGGQSLPLFDNEDDFQGQLAFEVALQALGLY